MNLSLSESASSFVDQRLRAGGRGAAVATGSSPATSVSVPLVRIDDSVLPLLSQMQKRVYLLKVDVQGFEVCYVLYSLMPVYKQHRV